MASSLRTTPPSDFLDRHEYGVIKNRTKPASTGGGRAWSEEEVRVLHHPIFSITPTNRSLVGSLPAPNTPPKDAL
ncbi:hypothetical protein V501_04067 [Pseudogymnoascus sp. VKM F-4519 (FW-2642)]|nr:hypothetical protein V501_04067 [Pseudogymnoascus sp. VKM F-4519 (FW-2642)]